MKEELKEWQVHNELFKREYRDNKLKFTQNVKNAVNDKIQRIWECNFLQISVINIILRL